MRIAPDIRCCVLTLSLAPLLAATDGPQILASHCASCHGGDARGTGKAPGLAANPRLAGRSAAELRAIIARGFPDTGMPAFDLPAAELDAVAGYVRDLNAGIQPSATDTRPRTWRAPQPGDWLTYNGDLSANRYSALNQINVTNVSRLHLKWLFPIPYFGLEVTPLEADGLMYVTGPNQVYAIDALTGAEIWKYARPQTRGLVGDAALGTNRGVAIREGLIFFVTDNAHLIALDRGTGSLIWETAMPRRTPALWRHAGAAGSERHGDRGRLGRGRGDPRIRGMLQSGHRRAAMEALDRSEGRRTWFDNLARQRASDGGRIHLVDRFLRQGHRYLILANRQSVSRFRRLRPRRR